jgi:hypothetical protein
MLCLVDLLIKRIHTFNTHLPMIRKLFKILGGGIAMVSGYCPECIRELNACHAHPCHICNVASCIRPIRLWQRFLNSL